MDGWMDGWMDGRMDGWMDGWMDGYTYLCKKLPLTRPNCRKRGWKLRHWPRLLLRHSTGSLLHFEATHHRL